MAMYAIKDTTLTALGDAVRKQTSETRIELVQGDIIEVVQAYPETYPDTTAQDFNITRKATINGATKIKLQIHYTINTTVVDTYYIQIKDDNTNTVVFQKYGPILSGTDDNRWEEIIIENTDKVSVNMKGNSMRVYGGVKFIATGLDENNEPLRQINEVEVKNTMTPAEMVDVINGLNIPNVNPIVLTGNQQYGCAGSIASTYIKLFGDTITTNGLYDTYNMFESSKLERIPFAINYSNTTHRNMNYMFYNAWDLVEIPTMTNVYPNAIGNLFAGCRSLRELPDNFGSDWNWDRLHTYDYSSMQNIFSNCYSLRRIPTTLLSNLWGIQTFSTYIFTYSTFSNCYALDEVKNMPIPQSTLTSNVFTGFVNNCNRLKELTFTVNEDGTPKTAKWKNQTIEMSHNSYPVGYAAVSSNIYSYNSGITTDKEVKDDATYQALKNDPDWFATSISYSRYNHDSAVNTINSLPDTSAYLATNGGTNTIKFKGMSGRYTDGGAIDTLTETEIAVATVKGWTVSLA